jgi:hypothetical protein
MGVGWERPSPGGRWVGTGDIDMGAWAREHEPPYGEGGLTVKHGELVLVTGLPTHKRWFTPSFGAYWRAVEREADIWAGYRARDAARKRAAKVANPDAEAAA